MSKMKSTAKKSLAKGLKTDGLKTPPSSPISKLSTVKGTPKAIREWLTSLPADSRAKTFQPPGGVPEYSPAKNPHCGLKWRKPFALFDRDTSSWKTPQISLVGGLNTFSEALPKWGILRHGALFRLADPKMDGVRMSGRGTAGKGCGLLPTVTCNDAKNNGGPGAMRRNDLALNAFVKLLLTVTVCGNHNRKGVSKTSGDGLVTAVKKMLPTVTASAANGPGTGGRQGGKNLQTAVFDLLPTPTANRRSGLQSHGKNAILGALNPNWVEWHMGWPVGWSDVAPLSETDWRDITEWETGIEIFTTVGKNRRNRIKALGNGQVPESAVLAWKILKGIIDENFTD